MKITAYRIKKGILYLKHYGPKVFWNRLKDKMEANKVPYAPWFERHKAGSMELRRQEKQWKKLPRQPLFSIIVPCYNPDIDYFFEVMQSLQEQSYGNWQLCIADASTNRQAEEMARNFRLLYDEKRISFVRLRENGGISENTNAGIAMARGEWLGFMDHDDLLAPNALYEMAVMINQDEEIEAIYTDEDQVERGKDGLIHQKPHFKPDFSPDLLRSNNYITHFFCVKGNLADQVGGFRKEFDGAQDYDFILRCTEAAKKVGHIPKVLYHWRIHGNSTADNPLSKSYAYEAGKHALEAHLSRVGEGGEVSQLQHFGFYRVKYAVSGSPLVSILILNQDNPEHLRRCIASIQQSSYQNYEVILVENSNMGQDAIAYGQELLGNTEIDRDREIMGQGKLPGGQAVKILQWKQGLHNAAAYNFAASHASGEYLALLDNGIELITKGWMEEMLGNCQRPGVGVVGARLYYPNNTIQHAGIVVGINGIAANMFSGMSRGQEGYYHKAALQLNYSAVTASCLMVSKEIYEKAHGMEEGLAVDFGGLDFCLRVRQEGYLVVYNPFVEGYYGKTGLCGQENSREKSQQYAEGRAFIRKRWMELLQKGDPYYNPNLSSKKCNYSL